MFAPGCAALGMRAIVLTDLDQPGSEVLAQARATVHEPHGVQFIVRDLLKEEIGFDRGSIDAFTSFAMIEHLHHSPKRALRSLKSALTPRGVFFIGAPNCVNLRKRITVPFGYGKWSRLEDWYEKEEFRGHVREPDLEDLLYIVRDMGLRPVSTQGRNWIGLNHRNPVIRLGTRLADRLLRIRPTLCSDIYVLARNAC